MHLRLVLVLILSTNRKPSSQELKSLHGEIRSFKNYTLKAVLKSTDITSEMLIFFFNLLSILVAEFSNHPTGESCST